MSIEAVSRTLPTINSTGCSNRFRIAVNFQLADVFDVPYKNDADRRTRRNFTPTIATDGHCVCIIEQRQFRQHFKGRKMDPAVTKEPCQQRVRNLLQRRIRCRNQIAVGAITSTWTRVWARRNEVCSSKAPIYFMRRGQMLLCF